MNGTSRDGWRMIRMALRSLWWLLWIIQSLSLPIMMWPWDRRISRPSVLLFPATRETYINDARHRVPQMTQYTDSHRWHKTQSSTDDTRQSPTDDTRQTPTDDTRHRVTQMTQYTKFHQINYRVPDMSQDTELHRWYQVWFYLHTKK